MFTTTYICSICTKICVLTLLKYFIWPWFNFFPPSLVSKNRSYDPIDYECINKTEFWMVEEESEGELGYDELESMLEDQ